MNPQEQLVEQVRVRACEDDIKTALDRHQCDLAFVQVLVNGSPTRAEIVVVTRNAAVAPPPNAPAEVDQGLVEATNAV